LTAVMAIAVPGISYAQLDLKAKAVETLTNGVMKELEKKFTETVAKEAISATAKAFVVKSLSEMSRPIVKNFIDSATSGKLPSPAELVTKVLNNVLPRVPEIVAAAAMEDVAGSVAQAVGQLPTTGQTPTAGQVQAVASAQLQHNYDDEKDFSVEIISGGSSVRITRYAGKSTELRIPPRIGDRPVTEIGERVFMKKGLTSVIIPDSVIFIGNMAFADNKIGSVSIGANVYIADNAFENTAYNSFSAEFYNSQGRKAGTYNNNWKLASAAAPQPAAQSARPGNTASAGTTVAATLASTTPVNFTAVEVISPTSGWEVSKDNNSNSNVIVAKEQIDGQEWNVLSIDVILRSSSGWSWAGAYLNNENVIQSLRNANGVRLKILGDGKEWCVQIITSGVKKPYYYYDTYIKLKTGKITSIDIPFKRLKEPGGVKFNKDNILGIAIVRNTSTGKGPATIKVFDFEIY